MKRQCIAGDVRSILMASLLVVLASSHAGAEQSGPMVQRVTVSGSDHYIAKTTASGEVKFQGSNTLYPLMTRLAMEFRQRQPQVRIDVRGEGSTKPLAAFLNAPQLGRVVLKEERSFPAILTSSRELNDSEIKEFVTNHGYEPTEIPVAMDAVSIYVHKDNPLEAITLDQVDAIFSKDHLRGHKTDIQQWGQLGLGNEWTNRPIHLYGRDRRSGTQRFFRDHALAGGDFREGLTEEPGAASVILTLSKDPAGMGYSGLGLQSTNVRVVPLAEAEGMPAIVPSAATIANKTYPLCRVLYLYLDNPPQRPLPSEVQEILRFIASAEGQQAVVSAGFFPVPTQEGSRSQQARQLQDSKSIGN